MNYIIFKIMNREVALELDDPNYNIEPTFINKFNQIKKRGTKIEGQINFKGSLIDVIDVSCIFNKRKKLKKFDGLIIVRNHVKNIAIKYEGFYKYSENPKCTRLSFESIFG